MHRIFGLIGYPLSHSFSKKYFSEKFEKESIEAKYELFEIENTRQFNKFFKNIDPNLQGLNVTIPYKQKIIPYLDKVDKSAEKIGAVNVIKIQNKKKIGYNSDYDGFLKTLEKIPEKYLAFPVMILGSGGASRAVQAVLKDWNIKFNIISRINSPKLIYEDHITYRHLEENLMRSHKLIINATPQGMYPDVEVFPNIPYHFLDDSHFLYDLVYNPIETKFLEKGKQQGAQTKNGLEMLYAQAEKAWQIWNEDI